MRVEPRLALLAAVALGLAAVAAIALRTSGEHDQASSSPAFTPVTDRAEQRRIGARALALVRYPVDHLGFRIIFAAGRAGIRAQTDTEARTVTVFLRAGEADHVVAHDIGHELGHVYDVTRMDARQRDAYLTARNAAGAAWSTASPDDYATGAGDFAEVFALCHVASPDFRSTLAARPAEPCRLLPKGAL